MKELIPWIRRAVRVDEGTSSASTTYTLIWDKEVTGFPGTGPWVRLKQDELNIHDQASWTLNRPRTVRWHTDGSSHDRYLATSGCPDSKGPTNALIENVRLEVE